VIDMSALRMWFGVLIGWLDRQERDALAYLIEENRILRAQLAGRHLRLTDEDRRRQWTGAGEAGSCQLEYVPWV